MIGQNGAEKSIFQSAHLKGHFSGAITSHEKQGWRGLNGNVFQSRIMSSMYIPGWLELFFGLRLGEHDQEETRQEFCAKRAGVAGRYTGVRPDLSRMKLAQRPEGAAW